MSHYGLETLKLPTLTGAMLKLVAWLIRFPVTRTATALVLLRNTGFYELRSQKVDEPPTMGPLWPAAVADTSALPVEGSDSRSSLPTFSDRPDRPTGFLSIRDFSKSYDSGETTPSKVAAKLIEFLKKEAAHQKPLNAVSQSHHEDIERQALESSERYRLGNPLSAIDGVPIIVKDEIDLTGYRTTVGTSFLGRQPATRDSAVVERLRSAGALLIGKANMHEIGINPNALNVNFGTVRNPYNDDREAGGSSSGSAAVVAAGLCPMAIAADGGGSIRIPAALCGMVGIKATYGRVSEFGAAPLCWSVAHLGPITTTVEDAAYSLKLISGEDQRDPHTVGHPPLDLAQFRNLDLAGIKIGVYKPWFNHCAEPIATQCRNAVYELERAGAVIEEIDIPELEFMAPAHAISILSEMRTAMSDYPKNFNDFGTSTQLNLSLAGFFKATDYLKAQRMRTRAMNIFAEVMTKVDVIATPTTAITAPRIPVKDLKHPWSDLSATIELMRYAFPGNLTGLPAITLTVGYDADNCPIGLQFMGRAWEETLLFRVAGAAERGSPIGKPPRHYDLFS